MLKCNPDDYREALAHFNMSTEAENELLFVLWDIMRMFAEMEHGVSSINNIFPSIFEKTDQDSGKLPESKHPE